MNVAQLQRLQQSMPSDDGQSLPQPAEAEGEDKSFKDTLEGAIDSVDESQKVADEKMEAFVAGEKEDLHDVMISMNQAEMQFQLMTEVRNKSMEAYKQLMRMQV